MGYRKKAKQYKKTSILTSSTERILLELYEAAIRHTKQAQECIRQKDIIGKSQHIGKAHDIVMELINSLNFEVGGKLSQDLESLYNFLIDHFIKANLENNIEDLKTCQRILETLLQGWKGAVEKIQKESENSSI